MTINIEPGDLNCDNAKDVCDVMDQMCNVEVHHPFRPILILRWPG